MFDSRFENRFDSRFVQRSARAMSVLLLGAVAFGCMPRADTPPTSAAIIARLRLTFMT
jgi:hypothetical protein